MLSIITGSPGSGKSNFIDCLCSRIALKHNWRITFASFETLPIERHVLTLCQIYLGLPTFAWMDGAATEEQLLSAIDALGEHFHFIMPDDHELNIESILEYVDDDIRDYGIQGFVLDPFTELEQSRFGGMSQTEMIEQILRKLQLFTRQRQIHTWLIAHPTKSGDTYKDGRPTMRSISGSSNFYNKADFGLVMHRHDDDKSTLYVDKVRFDSNGGRGEVEFAYSKARREYFTLGGTEKI
jgi:twinkle protein